MSIFGWTSTTFDKLLEKATSHLLLEPDWDAVLQICDCIRQNDVQPKYAVASIKKKLYAQNPHVVLYALQVLESCVKNCGAPVHVEVASRQFMEELRELVKNTTNENVRNRLLELIQTWAHAFRNEPKYRAIQDIFNLLRMEGYKLQAMKESDAMFTADTAPDWADGDCCHRCRVQFSVVQRKHHCRNCGQIFCGKCSSRNSAIPRFGIEKEVRVCEACWEKLNKPSGASKNSNSSHDSSPQQNSHESSNSAPGKSEQELKEEEDLQLALALSQSEAESKEKSVKSSSVHTSYSSSAVESNSSVEQSKKSILTPSDSELDRYLNRSYWEQKQQQQKEEQSESRTSPIPSAPVSTAPLSGGSVVYNSNKISEKYQNGETDELADFLVNLRGTLEIFVNRMKSNSSRGRPIANDTYVQSLFMNITNMHSHLLKYIQEQEDLRAYYEGLQDKLSQARDARAALDALREDNRERLRREAEEAERLRQIQMAQKLEIMRKQKQEYLQFQRQLAMQRMQEQEREMQLRHEQQKQQYQVMHQGGTLPPGVFPPPQTPYMPPVSQGYPTMHPPMPGMMHPGIPGSQPFPPPQIPTSVNSSTNQQMPGGDYRQPFNMQAMAGALPSIHPGAPFSHVPSSSGAPTSSSTQPPMIVMPQGVMGPMPPPQMAMMPPGIPQSMIQQNAPPTSVPSVPQPVMPQNPPVTNVAGIPQSMMPPVTNVPGIPAGQQMAPPASNVAVAPPPPGQEPPQPQQAPPPPVQEEPSDPLIVFD